jgi:hypothetical protein
MHHFMILQKTLYSQLDLDTLGLCNRLLQLGLAQRGLDPLGHKLSRLLGCPSHKATWVEESPVTGKS